jgi:hypothetical protein
MPSNKNIPIKITYDTHFSGVVLKALGKKVIEDGSIVDSDGEKVLSARGEEMQKKQFGGVIKGSEIYVQKDIDSILRFVESKGM